MLGLPAVTICSDPLLSDEEKLVSLSTVDTKAFLVTFSIYKIQYLLPSTPAILLFWLYVMSSVILVTELSFSAMKQDDLQERWCSFWCICCRRLCLLELDLVGRLRLRPRLNYLPVHSLHSCTRSRFVSPCGWIPYLLFSSNAIDGANHVLCLLMLFSITLLVCNPSAET
ncbi:hypothetical protein DVH24_035128 [Malus domestica]|uniref:Uncharacterized protein n=1 Tax=Malus domestica TaxID=3750 RepID=A0A498II57_MALDO|nr:hypothetical protein DVH24_035128 [Malus domestica]